MFCGLRVCDLLVPSHSPACACSLSIIPLCSISPTTFSFKSLMNQMAQRMVLVDSSGNGSKEYGTRKMIRRSTRPMSTLIPQPRRGVGLRICLMGWVSGNWREVIDISYIIMFAATIVNGVTIKNKDAHNNDYTTVIPPPLPPQPPLFPLTLVIVVGCC